MSRWAEAFRASVRSRDTVDTADTSSPDRTIEPPTPPPCVNSVSSVTAHGHMDDEAARLAVELSTVSAVSCAAKATNADASGSEQTAATERVISAAYFARPCNVHQAGLIRVALPSRGCFCSCCKGQRWWCERDAPKGWRCSTCHPPNDLPAKAVTEIWT